MNVEGSSKYKGGDRSGGNMKMMWYHAHVCSDCFILGAFQNSISPCKRN